MFIDKYHPGTGIVHLMGRSARLYNVMGVWGKNDEVFPGIVAAERPMGWGRVRHYPSLAPAGRLDAALSKLRLHFSYLAKVYGCKSFAKFGGS
jgi:hypothetical protein